MHPSSGGIAQPLDPTEPVVAFVSPHPDDCAFSLGGIFQSLQAGYGLAIVTVFTQSRFAPRLPKIAGAAINRVRWLEEESFARRVGAKAIALDFPDSSMRGYDDEAESACDPIAD